MMPPCANTVNHQLGQWHSLKNNVTRFVCRRIFSVQTEIGSSSSGEIKKTVEKVHSRMGKHYEKPDPNESLYRISFSLPSIQLDRFPVVLSNFESAKKIYERMVLDGNHEQTEAYVDDDASQLFEIIFPEIVQSRRIGQIEKRHFDAWDYRSEPERVLIERSFAILDQDGDGVISKAELQEFLQRANLPMDDDDDRVLLATLINDRDGSKGIGLDEFRHYWKSCRPNGTQPTTTADQESPLRPGTKNSSLQVHMENITKPIVENNVQIHLQPKNLEVDEHVDFLAVGGPSTYASALVHKAQYPDQSTLHIVGHRFDSNADGSAYYYHERDAFPAYVNRVNTGWYCVYIDLYKRLRSTKSLRNLCQEDRNHVKIGINWYNVLQKPWLLSSIFIPNTYHAMMDLIVRPPRDSLMAQACLHSQRVPQILERVCETLRLPMHAFLRREPDRAVHIEVDGCKQEGNYFDWLNKYAYLPYHSLDPSTFGSLVTEVLAFDRDGAFNPWMFENFHRAFEMVGIEHRTGWFLDCLYVNPDSQESHRLVGTAARFVNMNTGQFKVVSFDKMALSLGPSASIIVAHPDEDKEQRIVRRLLNPVQRTLGRGVDAHEATMWAAGSSSVCLLGVKRGAASSEKLDTFRKFIDGVNQHWTLISEREVRVGDDAYDFFAIQVTGGGHFPSRYTKPDFVLNLLYTTEALFGLNEFSKGDIMYDIVQTRGCGRSITARNTLSFCPLAKNVVSAYGLGGIGMTTAFANGALQLQILEALSNLEGDKAFKEGLRSGRIGQEEALSKLESFYGSNIFQGIDYTPMVDDPQKVARALNVDSSVSTQEKQYIFGTIVATLLGLVVCLV